MMNARITLAALSAATVASFASTARSAEAVEPDTNRLEEIVVTAEKVSRSLQDTATSIAVFSEEDLQARAGLDSTADLYSRIANVTIEGKTGSLPAVRGVDGTGPTTGAGAFLGGTRSRLAIQLDGRPLGFNESAYGANALWDVQQVEVLRGPQSTLQGRNAIAGTLAIKTKDPTYDWQGGLRLAGGDYDNRQGSFYASGPLVEDQLAFRVAYDRNEFDSFLVIPLHYPGVDDPEHYRIETMRAKLLIEPKALPGFKTVLSVNKLEFYGPQAEFVQHPFDDHVMYLNYSPRFEPHSTSAVAATSWELSENLTFENTLSYSDFGAERYSLPGDGIAHVDGHETVIEPRLRYEGADGRLKMLFGIYNYRASQSEFLDLSAFLGDAGIMNFSDSTSNTAAFTQLDYALSDQFELTVGGRYERETRERSGGNLFIVDLDKTYNSFLPKLGLAWHVNSAWTLGTVVGRSYGGGGAAFTFQPPFTNYEYEPEYVWNYETYWRAKLLDGKVFFTGNFFYSDFEDYQLELDINPDPQVFSFIVGNGKKVEAYGAEVGLRWLAATALTLSADAGLLRTKIVDYPGNSIEGNELARAPEFTARLGATYRHSSGFDMSIDANYTAAYFDDVANRPRERTEAYWLANAQVGYRFGGVRIFASAQNIFDDNSVTGISRGDTQEGDIAYIVRPRTWRAGVTMDF
jgi:iron complex outermembrane receptor protein